MRGAYRFRVFARDAVLVLDRRPWCVACGEDWRPEWRREDEVWLCPACHRDDVMAEAAKGNGLARLVVRASVVPAWAWDRGGATRSRPVREADGPPGGRLYFGPDGTPAGRSERWRRWAA